jgi:hypothetical protein
MRGAGVGPRPLARRGGRYENADSPAAGALSLLASASATGDASNADTITGPIENWRLVPFDNNLAQRDVTVETANPCDQMGALAGRDMAPFRVGPVGSAISRETAIGIAVTALALVAMVFDHLLGDDPGLEDPIAFIVAAVLTIACAFVVFGVVVPRTKGSAAPADRAATRGGVLAVVSVLSISLIWLGVTFPVAGGTLALGLLGRDSSRRRWLAYLAIVIAAIVLVVATVFSDWRSSS